MRTSGRALAALVVAAGLWLLAPAPTAYAGCGDSYGSHESGGGSVIDGSQGCPTTDPGDYHPGNGPYVPAGPPPPAYEDYWTPACMVNGPPSDGVTDDALCGAAVNVCDARGQKDALFMRHYRRLVGDPNANWEFVGTECRGASEPVKKEPVVTQTMVLDQAYAAAPHPTAMVQPGTRSYVNLPNNYYAEAPDQTVNVTVLGHPIAVRFTVSDITWDFGDGTGGTGEGVKDAAVGAPGAVEHAYTQQGTYAITATSTVGVQFTLPNGQAVNLPGAFRFTSDPVDLPIGEVQTRVDQTS